MSSRSTLRVAVKTLVREKCGVVVGGNAALWLRLDNLSERGGGHSVISCATRR